MTNREYLNTLTDFKLAGLIGPRSCPTAGCRLAGLAGEDGFGENTND